MEIRHYELPKFQKLGQVSLMSHRVYLGALKVSKEPGSGLILIFSQTGRTALLIMNKMKKS